MNCSIFRKKLNDLMEGSVTNDMKTAMEKHIEECSECSELYHMELTMDKAFKDAFSINDVSFTSSRAEIMKSVDKGRYGKNTGKKLHFHFKRYTAAYLSCAALIAFAVIFTPHIMKLGHSQMISENKANSVSQESPSSAPQVMMKSADIKGAKKASLKTSENSTPIFEKVGVDPKGKMPELNTPWVSSTSKKLSICIEGRGVEARNEGIGTIYVKNLSSGALWMMVNGVSNEKYSPLHLEWWDDENVLVVMGYAYGTIAKGGSLYLLNVETGAVSLVYLPENDKIQVVNAKKLGNKVQLELTVYEDENYNRSHSEERICETDMDTLVKANATDLNTPEIKTIYDFEKFANSKNYSGMMGLLSPSLKGTYTMDNAKPLKNITSMDITKLVEEPEWGIDRVEETYYTHKVFYAEVYYTVNDESYSYLKNGVYYHKVVVVQEKKGSPWTIAEMSASPPQ